jgi:catechol 2,3-dioxygenase-like lactoylglutathione lyase family enzyme
LSIIRIEDIAHVRYAAPDLAAMRAFLEDFGFICFEQDGRLYAKGSDGRPFLHVTEPGEPGFRGLGLRAETIKNLQTLARAERVPVEDSSEPGGGKVVRLTDPDGFRVEVVSGQARGDTSNPVVDEPRNSVNLRTRLRQLVRLEPGPSHVRRIGHAVLSVSDFRTSEKWYKERFGFLTSDEVEAAKDVPLGAFMRCNRGDKPADHHTLFLAQMPGARTILHAAFEVANLDDLMLGHQHLKAKQRTPFWGVGRHIMGSQVFDYWKDPWGHELEHWTDGDLLTAADPPNTMPLSALLAVQWGAPFPALTGKAAPPVGLLSFLMALRLRILRLFRSSPKETPA